MREVIYFIFLWYLPSVITVYLIGYYIIYDSNSKSLTRKSMMFFAFLIGIAGWISCIVYLVALIGYLIKKAIRTYPTTRLLSKRWKDYWNATIKKEV